MKRHNEKKDDGMQGEQRGQEPQEIQKTQELAAELLQKQEQVNELTADLQRTRADFENYRKQVELQKENEKKMVKLATVSRMLPLLDDIERAVASYEELKPLEGSLVKTLKELGLVKIEAGEGAEFNPDLHEAVMAEGEGEKEVIAEVLRPGYYYETGVLRPSMVKVKKV